MPRTDGYLDYFPDAPVMTDELRLELFHRYCKQYVFYKRHKRYVDCYCTGCMERYQIHCDNLSGSGEYYAEKSLAHNEVLTCPRCGGTVTAKAEGKGRGHLWDDKYICRLFPADNGNTIYILCGELYGGFGTSSDKLEEFSEWYEGPRWYPRHVIQLCSGGSVRAVKHCWYSGWYECPAENLFEPYLKESLYSGSCYFTIDNPHNLNRTFLKHSVNMKRLTGIPKDVFFKKIKYLMFLTRYPAVEMIDKIGGIDILTSIIDCDETFRQALDLSGKTAAEVFRTDSNTAARIKRLIASADLSLGDLKCYQRLKSFRIEEAIEFNRLVTNMGIDYVKAASIIKKTGLTPVKFSNYIHKQAEMKQCHIAAIWQPYCDYISECKLLGYDLKDPQINRPRDLYDAHGRTMSAARAIEEEKLSAEKREETENYRSVIYRRYVRRYEYSDGEYSIIVPYSAMDIVAEGKAMRHCVAGYAERHISGKLCILFLRKTAVPYSPLYTIEMNGDRCVQIQGYANSTPLTPEARKFFEKWKKWQAQPESKKHPKKEKSA